MWPRGPTKPAVSLPRKVASSVCGVNKLPTPNVCFWQPYHSFATGSSAPPADHFKSMATISPFRSRDQSIPALALQRTPARQDDPPCRTLLLHQLLDALAHGLP